MSEKPENQKQDWRDTVFLPKTDFPMKAGLAQKEPAILARWAVQSVNRVAGFLPANHFHELPPIGPGTVIAPLGTIDFWFMADARRVHKTVHHYVLEAQGGVLRFMANVVGTLWHEQSQHPLITPARVPIAHERVRASVLYPLDPNFNAVVDKEVDGDSSLPAPNTTSSCSTPAVTTPSAGRNFYSADYRSDFLGFRLASPAR